MRILCNNNVVVPIFLRFLVFDMFERDNPPACGYWFFTRTAPDPLVVAQKNCDGPWLDSTDCAAGLSGAVAKAGFAG